MDIAEGQLSFPDVPFHNHMQFVASGELHVSSES